MARWPDRSWAKTGLHPLRICKTAARSIGKSSLCFISDNETTKRPPLSIEMSKLQPPTEGWRIAADSAKQKKDAGAVEKETPTVSVPADKQQALLVEGPTVMTAPLWEPAGGTV